MAGDWIPMRTDLLDDPAVIQMAAKLGVDEFGVVGRLLKLWSWANRQLTDGAAFRVTPAWVDRFVSTPGFAAAMLEAGWLQSRSGGVLFPNFDRWNSQGAKRRLTQNRSKQQAGRHDGDEPATSDVAKLSPREEERRGEGKAGKDHPDPSCPEPPKPAASGPAPPPILTFPAVGTGAKEWHLTQSKVAEWAEAFPGVDVLAECRKARQWCVDNPTKRKTAKGMPAFLSSWLTRAQNTAPRQSHGAVPRGVPRPDRGHPPPGDGGGRVTAAPGDYAAAAARHIRVGGADDVRQAPAAHPPGQAAVVGHGPEGAPAADPGGLPR